MRRNRETQVSASIRQKRQNKCSIFKSDKNKTMKTNNKLKTNGKLIITAAILFAFGALTGCQTNAETKNGAANQPIVQAANNTKPPENTKPPQNIKTENTRIEINQPVDSADSPTATYKAAFTARQKKDLDGLKKVLSKRAIKFFTEMGKMDKKTLDDSLKEMMAQPQAATAEVRNEKVTGDKAALEYLDENGKWKPMDFVKEDGAWKMTLPDTPSMNDEDTGDDEDTTTKRK